MVLRSSNLCEFYVWEFYCFGIPVEWATFTLNSHWSDKVSHFRKYIWEDPIISSEFFDTFPDTVLPNRDQTFPMVFTLRIFKIRISGNGASFPHSNVQWPCFSIEHFDTQKILLSTQRFWSGVNLCTHVE